MSMIVLLKNYKMQDSKPLDYTIFLYGLRKVY